MPADLPARPLADLEIDLMNLAAYSVSVANTLAGWAFCHGPGSPGERDCREARRHILEGAHHLRLARLALGRPRPPAPPDGFHEADTVVLPPQGGG